MAAKIGVAPLCLFLFLLEPFSLAFVIPSKRHKCSSGTRTFGLREWRETVQDLSQKPILLLPFAADEALIQGQSINIRLTEGRFYDLFQDCIDDYESIVGMVLMGDDGLLDAMPLCEICDFDVEAGFRGKVTVSVTLKAVGRAKVSITQMKPVMMGMCIELEDNGVIDVKAANDLADDVELVISDMSRIDSDGVSMKERYDSAFQLALNTDSRANRAIKDEGLSVDKGERSKDELTAASWAVFCSVSDKASLYNAIATTSLTERLELGLKALLGEKYRSSATPKGSDGDIVGFE